MNKIGLVLLSISSFVFWSWDAMAQTKSSSSYEDRLNAVVSHQADHRLGTVSGRDPKEMRKRELYEAYTYVPSEVTRPKNVITPQELQQMKPEEFAKMTEGMKPEVVKSMMDAMHNEKDAATLGQKMAEFAREMKSDMAQRFQVGQEGSGIPSAPGSGTGMGRVEDRGSRNISFDDKLKLVGEFSNRNPGGLAPEHVRIHQQMEQIRASLSRGDSGTKGGKGLDRASLEQQLQGLEQQFRTSVESSYESQTRWFGNNYGSGAPGSGGGWSGSNNGGPMMGPSPGSGGGWAGPAGGGTGPGSGWTGASGGGSSPWVSGSGGGGNPGGWVPSASMGAMQSDTPMYGNSPNSQPGGAPAPGSGADWAPGSGGGAASGGSGTCGCSCSPGGC